MTIIGVILSFRQLAQSALHDVVEDRIPFLLSSVRDYHQQHNLRLGSFSNNIRIANNNGVPSDTMVSDMNL